MTHDDGAVHSHHLLNAVGWLYHKIRDDDDFFVDVLCLRLGQVLGALGDPGVQVVASAGNDRTSTPSNPAAFAVADERPTPPLVSVGSLNGTSFAAAVHAGKLAQAIAGGSAAVPSSPK